MVKILRCSALCRGRGLRTPSAGFFKEEKKGKIKMADNWDESEHPRDTIGRFTYKNGGSGGASGIVLEGGVQKTDYPDDWEGGNDGEGGWDDVLGGIGEVLKSIFGAILNPDTIQSVLGIFAAKYTMSELKNFEEMLSILSEAESNTAESSVYAQTNGNLIRQDYENERKMQNRADILYGKDEEYYKKFPHRNYQQIYESIADTVSNTKQKVIEFADNTKQALNNLVIEFTDNYIDKHFTNADKLKAISKAVMPDAVENLDMAFAEHHLDTPFARQHTVLRNADELSPILREHVKKHIFEQLAPDYGENCVKTTRGIYFENDSEPSKRIAESIAIKEYIQENKQTLKDYRYIKESSTKFGLTEFNLWGAIGRAKIAEMYLEKSGEITFYLIDTYDFNKNEDYFLIKAARLNQERGRLIPYFSVYSVKIDKDTAAKYLK